MVFEKLKDKLSKAYDQGRYASRLDTIFFTLDLGLIPLPSENQEENEHSMRSITDTLNKGIRRIEEDKRKYGILEKLAYNRGYKRG